MPIPLYADIRSDENNINNNENNDTNTRDPRSTNNAHTNAKQKHTAANSLPNDLPLRRNTFPDILRRMRGFGPSVGDAGEDISGHSFLRSTSR